MRARSHDGALESDERVRLARPVVEFSDRGARVLGDRYWLEVSRVSRGLVRSPRNTRAGAHGFGLGPRCSLRPGRGHESRSTKSGSCTYPIRGGLLARRQGGTLILSQAGGEQPSCARRRRLLPRLAASSSAVQRRVASSRSAGATSGA